MEAAARALSLPDSKVLNGGRRIKIRSPNHVSGVPRSETPGSVPLCESAPRVCSRVWRVGVLDYRRRGREEVLTGALHPASPVRDALTPG